MRNCFAITFMDVDGFPLAKCVPQLTSVCFMSFMCDVIMKEPAWPLAHGSNICVVHVRDLLHRTWWDEGFIGAF
jgi:hypothetical protein